MPDMSDIAPDFTLPVSGGTKITLSSLRPAPVVLFFYPRDNTPGCTRESTDFSVLLPEFVKSGAQVFGISKDSIASHDKFAQKQDLTVPLLSDADGQVCDDYRVWKEKNMYGKVFMGIERSTFLIDAHGNIARSWRKVKVPSHVDEVLAAVRAL